MTSTIRSSLGTTSRRASAAGHGIPARAPIAMLLTSVLVLATSSCSGASSSIVGSTTQDVQSFQVAAGDNQVGTAGSELPTPITVRALTQGGQGVRGVSVQWTFSGGGGSLTPDGSVSQSLTTVTDKQGNSSVYWQLDTIAGDQTATATLSGTSSNSKTTVKFHSHGKAGGPATLVVSPGADTLAVGDSIQFTATVLDRWKNVISGATVSWSSSNDSVVTVSSTGMAKALRSGSATVIATTSASSTSAAGTSSISGGASVSVESSTTSTTTPPGTVTNLKVSSATDSSVTLTWTQVDDGTGSPAKYALRYGTPTISWSAAYSTEVSVNGTSIGATESYTFKGLQAGTSYQFQLVSYRGTLNVDAVFGTLSNVVSGSTTGTGTLQTSSVTVTPASLSFTSLNATAQLSAVAKDSTGNTVTNPGFTWKSLATSIATVSTTGLVTAKAVGATVIIVTAACCGSDTAAVNVSTSGTFQTPTVTVTPASLSFTSLNATAQLSAVAKDSTGNTVTNPGFTWKSLATSIATVSTSGLVTAKAVGATAIIVTAACCGSDTAAVTVDTLTSSGQVTPYFQDGFESGNLSHTQNGFHWTGGTGNFGPNVSINTNPAYAHSGSNSLQFHYKAVPSGSDDDSEQHFQLAAGAGSAPTQVWLDYYLRIPDNFTLRQDNPNNDKLYYLWGQANYGDSNGVFTGLEYEGTNSDIVAHFNTYPNNHGNADYYTYNAPLFTTAQNGTWVHVQVYFRAGSPTDPGAVEGWFNGVKKFAYKSDTESLYTSTSDNYWLYGYLMGWANSGFANDTYFYIDDFKVYTSNPGW